MFRKFPKNKKYTQIALYVFITAGALMILWQLVTSSSNLWASFKEIFNFLWGSVATIVSGLILGYILSPAVSLFDTFFNKVFNKKKAEKREKRLHILAIALVYVLLILIIVGVITFIIPPLVDNIVQLSEHLPEYIDAIIEWYDNNLKDSPLFTSEYTRDIIETSQTTATERMNEIAVAVVTAVANSVFSIFSSIIKFVIAFIISFYYLLSSKEVVSGVSEFGRLRLGKERADSVATFLRSVDWVFGKYISAKLLQIAILFVITQIFFLILGVSLSTLMAFILAVANIIPYVGGFIGMIPAVVISLIEDPLKGLWVFLAVQVVQFIDNYIIQPFLIGDKMGLSPFWALVVVIIGGNLFGFTGVLLSIPVAAVIRILIKRYVNVQKRKLEEEAKVK